jgi:hypothetical protein
MSIDGLSREAFARRFAALFERIEGIGPALTSPVREGGKAVDVLVNAVHLYNGNAVGFAAQQVDAFMEKPLRIFMERPNDGGLVSPICVDLHDALGKFLLDHGIDEINRQVNEDSPTFLVVFGLGLGLHIPELVRRTKARWLIIAEPMLEFIAHSFATLDWSALFTELEERGGGVEIVTENNPALMVSAIVRYMSARGIPYADGSYVFTHYPFWAFTEGRTRLYEAVEFAFLNRGFFEDELVMMKNAVTNFAAAPFLLMEGRPRLHRPEFAIVAGAGPSLDEALPRLKEIRDRVMLFSAGTALRPLLRNGLIPDFHCELENVPATIDALREAARYGDLSQVTLIASATVDPRMPPLFGETIYFFRDSVSSTLILGAKHLPIAGAAPTCVNMALSMAAFFGFTDMALVGADCGVRPGGDDHAKDTVYRDVGMFQKTGDLAERFPMELEANFGGMVRTNWVYDACRLMLADVIQQRRLNVFNASDGAFIPGAVPRVPEMIAPEGPSLDRAAIAAALKGALEMWTPAEIFAETDLRETARRAEALFIDLDRLLDELAAGGTDFAAVYTGLRSFLDDCGERYGSTESLLSGTLHALARIALFFGFRVADAGIRDGLFACFIAELKKTIARMRAEVAALFQELGRQLPPTEKAAGQLTLAS